jgi:hypothetical protein
MQNKAPNAFGALNQAAPRLPSASRHDQLLQQPSQLCADTGWRRSLVVNRKHVARPRRDAQTSSCLAAADRDHVDLGDVLAGVAQLAGLTGSRPRWDARVGDRANLPAARKLEA